MSTTEQTSKPILKLWLPGRVGMLTLMMFIIALLINFLLFEIGLAIPFFYGVVLAAIDWYRMRRPFKATLHLVFGFVLTIAALATVYYLRLNFRTEDYESIYQISGFVIAFVVVSYLHLALERDVTRLQQSFSIQPASERTALLIVVIVGITMLFVQRGIERATYIVAIPRPETTSIFIDGSHPSISGSVHAWVDAPINQRHIVLCNLEENLLRPYYCIVTTLTATTNNQGKFQFENVPVGRYLVFYDSGSADFNAGIQDWAGKRMNLGDYFLEETFWLKNPNGLILYVPKNTNRNYFYHDYTELTLMVSGSPFVVAHDMRAASAYQKETWPWLILPRGVFVPTVIEVAAGRTSQVDFDVDYFGK